MLDPTSLDWLDAYQRGDQQEVERLGVLLNIADRLEQQRRHDPAALYHAARDYAAAGIPVFPCQPRGKRPLSDHGFKDASCDPDQISAWWMTWPDANIATPTGITFDVVDIDGREGITAVYNGEHALVDDLTVLGVALTSRDAGRHLYVPPTGRGNATAILPGVDYRGTGGYVVVPPSVGANGRVYTWASPLQVGE